jgi:hypothetical protein
MAKSNVRLDYDELVKLKEQIEQFGDATQVDLFLTSCAKELAARLLRKVIKRTPVGKGEYTDKKGVKHKIPNYVGGTLRRGWTTGSTGDSSHDTKQAMYNNMFGGSGTVSQSNMTVTKVGTDYVIEIINPVEYASYVEFGHRTRNHKGWVEGQFMLTISEDEIRKSAPKILEKKLETYLKGCFK